MTTYTIKSPPIELWVGKDGTYRFPNISVPQNNTNQIPVFNVLRGRDYAIHICNELKNVPFYISGDSRFNKSNAWINNIIPGTNRMMQNTGYSEGLFPFSVNRDATIGSSFYLRSPDYDRPLLEFKVGASQTKTSSPYFTSKTQGFILNI